MFWKTDSIGSKSKRLAWPRSEPENFAVVFKAQFKRAIATLFSLEQFEAGSSVKQFLLLDTGLIAFWIVSPISV